MKKRGIKQILINHQEKEGKMEKTKKRSGKILLLTYFLLLVVMPIVLSAEGDTNPHFMPYLLNPMDPWESFDQDLKLGVSLYSGAANSFYTIELPPGTNNLQPQLNLFYNSYNSIRQKPGILGSGWRLSQSYIQRNVNHTFENISDDSFELVLNGNSYELIYVLNEDKYHTKIGSFLYIENKTGGNNTKDKYWIVKSKEGTTYRFGYHNSSELVSNLHNYTVKWSLDLVNNTYGNSIFYSHLEDPYAKDLGTVYPSKIEYNNDKSRVINFIFEDSDRLDKWLVYDQGNKIRESRRLKELTIFADNSLVRRYVLEYNAVDDKKALSFLTNITEYGSDNSTNLFPIKFSYNNINEGFGLNDYLEPPTCFVKRDGEDEGVRIADVNGDGLIDILKGKEGDSTAAWISNGSGWINNDSWEPPTYFVDDRGRDEGVRLADVNGDGLVDVLKYKCGGSSTVWINNGAGWVQNDSWEPPACFVLSRGQDEGVRLADVNGDGLVDVLYGEEDSNDDCEDDDKQAWINNGTGWVEDDDWEPPKCFVSYEGGDLGNNLVDINGDRLPDVPYYLPSGGYTLVNNGTGWVKDYSWKPPVDIRFSWGTVLADVNGDGLADILRGDGGAGNLCYDEDKQAWINNGTGWVEDDDWEPPKCFVNQDNVDKGLRLIDINGNGLVDLLYGREEYGGGCGDGGGGGVIGKINQTGELELSNIGDIISRQGDKKTLFLNVKNIGGIFLNKCKLKIRGEISSWIYSDQIEGIAPGQNFDFVFDLNIPEGIEKGDYLGELEISCDEFNESQEIKVIIAGGLQLIEIKEIKHEKQGLEVSYSFDNSGIIGEEVSVEIWITDDQGTEIKRYMDSFSINRDEVIERNILIDIPSDLIGIYSVYFALSSDLENYVKQNIVLGKAVSGGFAVFDTTTGKVVGYVVFGLMVLGILYFVFKRSWGNGVRKKTGKGKKSRKDVEKKKVKGGVMKVKEMKEEGKKKVEVKKSGKELKSKKKLKESPSEGSLLSYFRK